MSAKILVIEDDPATALLVEYTLTRQGFTVITASEGYDGLQQARLHQPAVVIMDVMLPGIDGYELCRRLRGDPATANVRILMFSARAQPADREAGTAAGANAYLTKPAAPGDIVRAVRDLAEKE
jgi:DNA-binding response OmpR family regulator